MSYACFTVLYWGLIHYVGNYYDDIINQQLADYFAKQMNSNFL